MGAEGFPLKTPLGHLCQAHKQGFFLLLLPYPALQKHLLGPGLDTPSAKVYLCGPDSPRRIQIEPESEPAEFKEIEINLIWTILCKIVQPFNPIRFRRRWYIQLEAL